MNRINKWQSTGTLAAECHNDATSKLTKWLTLACKWLTDSHDWLVEPNNPGLKKRRKKKRRKQETIINSVDFFFGDRVTATGFQGNLGATVISAGLSEWQALAIELCLTFVLVLVYLTTMDDHRRALPASIGPGPLTLGLSYAACSFVAVTIHFHHWLIWVAFFFLSFFLSFSLFPPLEMF